MLVDPAVERLAQGVLPADRAEQLDLRRRQLEGRRRDIDPGRLGGDDDLGHRRARIGQDVGNGPLNRPEVDAEPDGQVGLGVHVDAQDAIALLGQGTPKVDCGRRLADAALLIRNRDHIRHGRITSM